MQFFVERTGRCTDGQDEGAMKFQSKIGGQGYPLISIVRFADFVESRSSSIKLEWFLTFLFNRLGVYQIIRGVIEVMNLTCSHYSINIRSVWPQIKCSALDFLDFKNKKIPYSYMNSQEYHKFLVLLTASKILPKNNGVCQEKLV